MVEADLPWLDVEEVDHCLSDCDTELIAPGQSVEAGESRDGAFQELGEHVGRCERDTGAALRIEQLQDSVCGSCDGETCICCVLGIGKHSSRNRAGAGKIGGVDACLVWFD